MDPSTSINMFEDLPDNYHVYEDYGWHFPPNNSTETSYPALQVEKEREHDVVLPNTSELVLTSSVTTAFLPLIYIIIFIVGLPTNAMAIWVFLIRMKKKNPASILLANLALADLLFIIWLPMKIHYHFSGNDWTFGEPLCKVLVSFFYGNMYCSTIFIACISVQRYWAITHPLSYKLTNRVAVCVSVCVWIVVWLLTIPLYQYDQTVKVANLNITTCQDVIRPSQEHWPAWYFRTMGIVGYVVPCVVCVVAYLLTFRSLRRSMMDSCTNKRKRKAVVFMVIVLVMFLVCFTPSNILLMVHSFTLYNDNYKLYIVALCLGSLNSCLDPFVYYFISSEFREHVIKMLICHSKQTASIIRCSYKPMSIHTESPTPPTDTALPAFLDQTDSTHCKTQQTDLGSGQPGEKTTVVQWQKS
ncbi:proteinase-activated receptor 2 [Astyanax mexicanus]|uniref:proteinase-activated receptor 2 n=1 Tax=Astyanax mexicanus TaxID=7994 RepID=UPI0020CB02BB|nr:proteinase-activated receptor 2 [Astyanax mexicanus]